jgi:gliding motility-associated-like protein
VNAGDDIHASCIDVNTLFAQVTGGQPGFTYQWFVEGDLIGTGNVVNYQTYVSTTVEVVVTDECGFVGMDELVITIPSDPIYLEVSPDTAICLGSTIALYASATGGEGGFTYEWPDHGYEQPWIQVSPQGPESYPVIARDICGRAISAIIDVDVQFVNAHIDLEYLTETLVQFTGSTFPDSCETCTYWWEFGDGATSDNLTPQHEYTGVQEYTASFEVENEIGCRSIDYAIINPPLHIYIPNAFTPDGDGNNDVFQAVATGITEFQMWIFNRWGEQVFYTDNIDVPWLGGMENGDYFVQDGLYNWTVKYKGANLVEYRRTGHVQILR